MDLKNTVAISYLTPEEKAETLRELEILYQEPPGCEKLDAPIVRWLRKINIIDGICTTASCTHNGILCLRLSESLAANFKKCLKPLMSCPSIYTVRLFYTYSDDIIREEMVIKFTCSDSPAIDELYNDFDNAMETIVDVLESLSVITQKNNEQDAV